MKSIVFFFALILSLMVFSSVDAKICVADLGCSEEEYCDKKFLGISGTCVKYPVTGEKCNVRIGCLDGLCEFGVCAAVSPSL